MFGMKKSTQVNSIIIVKPEFISGLISDCPDGFEAF